MDSATVTPPCEGANPGINGGQPDQPKPPIRRDLGKTSILLLLLLLLSFPCR